MVAEALVRRWGLGRTKDRFRGRIAEGRVDGAPMGGQGAAGSPRVAARSPRVAVLCPQTYMNEAGRSAGPARGAFKLPLDRVLVVHDEIDLPFGDVRTQRGGGLAGHNGLKSLKRELGGADFVRVRVGVGRPDSTDPEIVSDYVLGRFRESEQQVAELIERACEQVEAVVLGDVQTAGGSSPAAGSSPAGGARTAGGAPPGKASA